MAHAFDPMVSVGVSWGILCRKEVLAAFRKSDEESQEYRLAA
jgi:hypothetical protein